ncbi:MAG TPA: response regulator transcription factor [Caldithrix abyssi]|uniref:Response regulator transcription factor n=1 Tax=Caldithrix abyssi TaxID=187145 RepID=A0A7V5H364_CALAY|nr:response regulator transcription factor [Caldithrix abyssi]
MAKAKIFIVDDEEDILDLVDYVLSKEGYTVERFHTGEEILRKVKSDLPNLILLDLMLPGVDGLDVCKLLKRTSNTANIPIIMLTAKGEEADIVTGLELGADDYIPKPFSTKILLARVKSVLRRRTCKEMDQMEVIKVHDLVIHPGRREVLVKNKPVSLTYTEFSLLYFLAKRPGWVFTRYQIVDALRGEDYPVTERSVDVQVVGIRKKLGEAGKYIETVRGVGYRFREHL